MVKHTTQVRCFNSILFSVYYLSHYTFSSWRTCLSFVFRYRFIIRLRKRNNFHCDNSKAYLESALALIVSEEGFSSCTIFHYFSSFFCITKNSNIKINSTFLTSSFFYVFMKFPFVCIDYFLEQFCSNE